MKRRIFRALVCLFYVCIAVVFGGLHHHEHVSLTGHDDCPACVWQLNGATDVPVVADVSLAPLTIECDLPVLTSVVPASPFLPATGSRAPPELV
jgi:hypothetical protein